MQGYSVHLNKKKNNENRNNNFSKEYSQTEEKTNENSSVAENHNLSASAGAEKVIIPQNTPSLFDKKEIDSNEPLQVGDCDVIKLKNGKEIKGKVIEVSPNIIKYTKCDDESGRPITIVKTDVATIAYSNGTEDNFTNVQRNDNFIEDDTVTRKTRKYAKLSLMFGILSLIPIYGIVLGVMSILYGSNSLHKFKKYPLENEVKIKALIGLCLGIVGVIIGIVIILIFLSSINLALI